MTVRNTKYADGCRICGCKMIVPSWSICDKLECELLAVKESQQKKKDKRKKKS